MRRMIFVGALLALLVLPSAASARVTAGDHARAVKDCRILKEDLGRGTFRATFHRAGTAAFTRCVRQMTAEESENRIEAVQECRAEREADPVAFKETYGTDPGGANAFGICVAKKRRAASREDRADIVNAAHACMAERDEWGGDAFRDEYGTNDNGRNAFGKCVSQKASAADDEDDGETAA